MDFIIPGAAIRKTVVKTPSSKANAGTLETVQGRNSAARGASTPEPTGDPRAGASAAQPHVPTPCPSTHESRGGLLDETSGYRHCEGRTAL